MIALGVQFVKHRSLRQVFRSAKPPAILQWRWPSQMLRSCSTSKPVSTRQGFIPPPVLLFATRDFLLELVFVRSFRMKILCLFYSAKLSSLVFSKSTPTSGNGMELGASLKAQPARAEKGLIWKAAIFFRENWKPFSFWRRLE